MEIADIQIMPAVLNLDAETRTGTLSVTITNQLGRAARLHLQVTTLDGARKNWFRIEARHQRLQLARDETVVFDLEVVVPPDEPAGTYGFQLICADELDPANVFATSEQRDLIVSPRASRPRSRKRLYLMLAIGGVLLVGGAVTAAILLVNPKPRGCAAAGAAPCPAGQTCSPAGVCEGRPEPPVTPKTDTCVEDMGRTCGQCAGTITCAGDCSRPTPANLGRSCGHCGGIYGCDGKCSKDDPPNFGHGCGSCGGTIGCDGQCNRATPAGFGQSCGPCGGTIACDGQCTRPPPAALGQSCGRCGGTIDCSGACNRATPVNFGVACGNCGGTIGCDGRCSRDDPPGLGTVTSKLLTSDRIYCCSINEVRQYGGACDPGHAYHSVDVVERRGGGDCRLEEAGSGRNCVVKVRWTNNGLEGVECDINIKQKRVCD